MTQTKLPLDGVKVLDLSRVLAGPWTSMSLGDLGAEVWKIESTAGGDDTRAWSVPNYKGVGTYYLCANRGKNSISVDLKTPEGRKIVLDLAAQADVVVENFRPGTVDRLGIGYEAISRINPRIVYCSISGYGQNGPERDRPGYDFIMQAESGLMAITGDVSGPPTRLGVAFTDVVTGMVAAQSILAALLQMRDTGKGQYIDIALLEATMNMLINVGTGYLNAGVEAVRYGNAHPTVVPYQVFETQDSTFALAVGNDRMFQDLCRNVIDMPDMAADPRFLTSAARAVNRDALLDILSARFLTGTCQHWLDKCLAASVPAGRVKSVSDAFDSPTVRARGIVQELCHPILGAVRMIAPAHGLAGQRDRTPKAPPLLGEDTGRVLRDVLGYSEERIGQMEKAGAIYCNPMALQNSTAG